MEFSIDIHTHLDGEVIIEDFSKEYGQYLDEDLQVVTSYDYYKYSESATLNCITKVSINNITLLDVLLHDHIEDYRHLLKLHYRLIIDIRAGTVLLPSSV